MYKFAFVAAALALTACVGVTPQQMEAREDAMCRESAQRGELMRGCVRLSDKDEYYYVPSAGAMRNNLIYKAVYNGSYGAASAVWGGVR